MPKIVLIVDDNNEVREIAVSLVESLGYRAVAVTNGNDALRVVANGRVDAVLTDVMMPGMSGYELVERIRKEQPQVAIVCATGYGDIVEADRLPGHLLIKPYRASKLRETLEAALAGQGTR